MHCFFLLLEKDFNYLYAQILSAHVLKSTEEKKLNDFDGPGKIISVKLNKINAIVSFVLGHFV